MDKPPETVEVQRLVNRMTNRQRNRWAKAGYPGLRPANPERVKPFVPAEPYMVEESGNG
jgi:hypothetical protein